MAHDQKSRPLEAGDVILIPAVVTEVSAGEDFCNITAKSIFGRRPDGGKETFVGNTAVVLRANKDDHNKPEDYLTL